MGFRKELFIYIYIYIVVRNVNIYICSNDDALTRWHHHVNKGLHNSINGAVFVLNFVFLQINKHGNAPIYKGSMMSNNLRARIRAGSSYLEFNESLRV